ncbi:MAG: ketosteroid isomerase family protein [Cyanobacteria bacterium J06627_32]
MALSKATKRQAIAKNHDGRSLGPSLQLPKPLQQYFDTLNAQAFDQTAQLFLPEGQLVPPFENAIVGRAAIAAYLADQALDMTLVPRQLERIEPTTPAEASEDNYQRLTVMGKVKTPIFKVNVAWHFVLDAAGSIKTVNVKLLAKLTQLLTIKR